MFIIPISVLYSSAGDLPMDLSSNQQWYNIHNDFYDICTIT